MEAKYMTTPDDGSDPREVQTGEVGELYLRGPNIFLDYHKNPSATADSISKDGWFRTGDVGYQDFKGNFFITDRVKELIEYKGFQVAPAELRGILVGHAAVNDVAVIQLTRLPHVHLSRVGGYSLADLKKICQRIIHFEPAFETLLPEDRLSNECARSNWLDNANFGHRNLSRKQSIAAIQRSSSMRELVLLMNPNHDKMFGWNFLYLLNSPNGTIEFRRGAACTSAQQAFVYIEIAMSFIEASVQLGSPENLETAPGTVGGLNQFISAARFSNNVPGLYDSRYLSLFFGNKTDGTFREPKPLGKLSAYQLNKLNKKKEDDKKNVAMVKMLHEPYWS
ncbi:hypothetical protein AFGD_006833 [Aspergillus flavus]|nr:hypothetical protein AFGD_006833 [Aspergillus flavus]